MIASGARGTKTDRLLRRGIAAHQAGDFAQAERCYRKILAVKPKHPEALRFLGMVVAQSGDSHAALMLFQRARDCRPDDPVSHLDLGNACLTIEDFAAAERCFDRAIALSAALAAGHHGLGVALERQGRIEAATACYRQAVILEPNFAAAHLALGGVLHDLGRLDDAVAAYGRALDASPGWDDAHFNLGRALADQGRYAEAEGHYRSVLKSRPDAVYVLVNLTAVLIAQSKFPEAKSLVERVLRLDPKCIHALHNLGVLMHLELRFADAEACYRRALEIDAGNPESLYSLGEARLGMGDFGAGWEGYRYRPARRQFQHEFPQVSLAKDLPRDLSGKRVVLLKEQGLGDELFFLRFAPALKRRGATIVCRTSPPLKGVLSRVSHLDEVDDRASMDVLAQSGIASLVGDLPSLCAGEEDTPAPVALTVLPERLAAMRTRFAQLGPPPYHGLTWRAGISPGERQQRGAYADTLFKEIPVEQLAACLRGVRGTWIAVQRKPKHGELAEFGRGLGQTLHDFTEYNNDLEDMLAILTLLDDYIGVSNTNTHLCAGIGRTQHVLVPRPPEWRWMKEGMSSPWFPGFSLYRQRGDGDWSVALDALTIRLGR